MIRVGRFVRATVAFLLIVMLMTAVSLLPGGGRAHADPVSTFSGVLADQSGNPLSGTTVTLTNASGSAVSAVTSGDGSFSVSASPDVYYLTLASTNTSGMNFTVRQSSAAPGIDLTAGSVAQNLTLPVAPVNYTAYTAQGAPDAGNLVTASSDTTPGSAVSLYSGDPGETYVHVTNAATLTADAQGAGSFTSIVGANYTSGICDYTSTGAVIGCNTTPLTVGSGANSVSVPHAPLPHYAFSGVLADQHGNALAGVSLSLSDADGNVTSTTTDAGGAFSLSVVSGMYRISNLSGTNVDGFYLLGLKQTGAPSINLTAGNMTQNLTLPVTTVSYTAYDTQGYVNATGTVDAGSAYTSSSLISLYPGDPGEWASVNTGPINPSAQGTGTFNTLVGVVYAPNTICDFTASNTLIGCNTAQFTATSGTNKVVIPIPPTPANLTAASPTSEPSLSWTAVASASSYNICRDGVKIATTTTESFVDNNVAGGAHAYYVTAVDGVGDESTPSNTINVTVNLVAPTLGTPTFTPNPVIQGQPTTVTVIVQGNLYGIVGGEYYIGNTDPGQGHGIAMTYSNGTLSAVLSGLALGSQTIHVRAQNSVGWSSLANGTVTVVKPAFSGTLTDSNGLALSGVSITISDVHGNTGSTTTSATGAFSIAVTPGMYYISNLTGNNIDGIAGSFTLRQSTASPSIDLTIGNITQNLTLPVATVNYTAYNAQGYLLTFQRVTAYANPVSSGNTLSGSLYAGDPGETIIASSGTLYTNAQGAGTFKSIVGAIYTPSSGTNGGVCDLDGSFNIIGCAALTVVAGTNTVDVPHTPAPRNTFSGTLTDSNGVVLVGVSLTMTDSHNNVVSTTTGAGGVFSLAVEPGMYALTISGNNIDGIAGSFTLRQSTTNPQINLVAGNLVQSLTLPVATVNYTAYNAEGYLLTYGRILANANPNYSNNVLSGSLYAGDPGETINISTSGLTSSAQGTGSFKTIVGAVYASSPGTTGGICDLDGSFNIIGCAALTVVAGTNTVDVPHTPAPRNTFSGTLTDSNGLALAGVAVSLRDVDNDYVSTTTGAGGVFSLAVEPGMYALTISGNNIDGIASFSLAQSATTPSINLTTGNVIQDLVLPVATVNFTAYDAQGNLDVGTNPGKVLAISSDVASRVSLYAGDPGGGQVYVNAGGYITVTSQGTGSFKTIIGVKYAGTSTNDGICAFDWQLHQIGCNATSFTVTNGMNTLAVPELPAPTGLVATSPTTEPSLSWTTVSGATSYDVYRDGVKIGSTTSASYLDATAPEGTYTYYVKAVDDAGDASAASNTVSVEVQGVDQAVAYYTVNDGSTFSKESSASTSGVSTQTDNSDGTVTVSVNSATGYADSGFTTWTGTLGSLPEFTVTGSGDQFGLNIWFDTDNDSSFFSWDSNGTLTGLGSDTYGISSGSTDGVLSVTGDTSFYMLDDNQSYTLAQLIAGDDPTSGINADTVVTIWIGVDATDGSASATIDSIGALEQV